MAKSKFEKYRDILREETAKVKRGEKSNILNAGNFLASILFLVLVSVWSYYFTVTRDSSRSVKKDRILKVVFLDTGPGDGAVIFSPSGKIGIIDSGAISGSPEADSDTAQVVHNNPAYKNNSVAGKGNRFENKFLCSFECGIFCCVISGSGPLRRFFYSSGKWSSPCESICVRREPAVCSLQIPFGTF